MFVHAIVSVYLHRYDKSSCQGLQLRSLPNKGILEKLIVKKYFAFAIILPETFSWSVWDQMLLDQSDKCVSPGSVLTNFVTSAMLVSLWLNVFIL